MVEEVKAYKCEDGTVFLNEEDAVKHEAELKLEEAIKEDNVFSRHAGFEDVKDWLNNNADLIMGFLKREMGGRKILEAVKEMYRVEDKVIDDIIRLGGAENEDFVEDHRWQVAYNKLSCSWGREKVFYLEDEDVYS